MDFRGLAAMSKNYQRVNHHENHHENYHYETLLPSGEHTKSNGLDPPFFMGKFHYFYSMAIFHRFFYVHQVGSPEKTRWNPRDFPLKSTVKSTGGAWSASGVPLLYSIYSGRMAGITAATALGAKEKLMELSAVASDLVDLDLAEVFCWGKRWETKNGTMEIFWWYD